MKKYDLFISYNSLDRAEINRIREQLRQKPNPLQSFIDFESLTIGQSWAEEIEDAILNSRAVAVFYGKNGLGRWQNLELTIRGDFYGAITERHAGLAEKIENPFYFTLLPFTFLNFFFLLAAVRPPAIFLEWVMKDTTAHVSRADLS